MDYLAFIQPGDFRDNLVALESATLEMERVALAYEAASKISEIHRYEAELQCYAESGDVFKLAEYYEAAEQKDSQNKEGLFQKIWNGIKNVWNKIKSVITGDTSGGNPEDQVEVNGPLYALSSIICDSAAEISKMVAHPIQYFINGNGWGKLTEIITFDLATKGVKKVARKALEKRKEQLQGIIEKVTGPFDQIPGKVKKWATDNGWGKNVDEVEGFIPKLMARISSCVSAIAGALHIGKKKDGDQQNTDQNNGDQTQTKDAGNNQPANNGNQAEQNNGQQPNNNQNDDQQGTNDGQAQPAQKNDNGQNDNQNGNKNNQTEEPQKKPGLVQRAKDAITGKNKKKNNDEEKTESGEDFINSVFDGLEGFAESVDSDIDHLIDDSDDAFLESGEASVMETVDELTELFKGYF